MEELEFSLLCGRRDQPLSLTKILVMWVGRAWASGKVFVTEQLPRNRTCNYSIQQTAEGTGLTQAGCWGRKINTTRPFSERSRPPGFLLSLFKVFLPSRAAHFCSEGTRVLRSTYPAATGGSGVGSGS